MVLFSILQGLPVQAQDAPGEAKANPGDSETATSGNPEIPVDHLELLLEPLTQAELLVEAEEWRDLVKGKVRQVSIMDIAIRKKGDEIEKAAADPTVSESEESAKIEDKTDTIESLTALREEKSALLERFSTVLDAYEEKGGDAAEFRAYAAAVVGIKLKGADSAAVVSALAAWFVSKEGGLKVAGYAIKFLVIMLVFWIIAAIAGRLVRRATEMQAGMSDLLKRFLNKIVRRVTLFIGILVGLGTIGVNVSALLAFMGGGAFIIGFALQDTLGNLAAGMMLLVYRPFDVGDVVEVGGVSGKVDNVSLVSTTIRTFDNKVILVPNQAVWGEVITNSSASSKRRVDLVFGIGYEDDMKTAQEILERIVSDHELTLSDPEPVIRVHELADSSVNFICRPWCATDDYWTVYWDLTRKVKEEFDGAGVSIPFPQQDVHLHQATSGSPALESGA